MLSLTVTSRELRRLPTAKNLYPSDTDPFITVLTYLRTIQFDSVFPDLEPRLSRPHIIPPL